MANPYIPPRDADFDTWLLNFTTKLTAAPTTYGLIAGDATACAAQYTAWHAAYLATTIPATRTPVTIATKDTAKITALLVIRPYAQRIAVNPAVTNGDKVAIGVNPRGTVPTPVPAPTSFPVLGLISITPGQAQIKYHDSALGTGKNKPVGAIGMELWLGTGTTPITPPTGLSYQNTFTKSPLFVDTTGHAGATVQLFARWITRSGPAGVAQPGPWSTSLGFTAN